MTQPTDSAAFVERLASIVGPAGLVTAPADMKPFLTDWRGLAEGQATAIVQPSTTEQVSKTLKLCTAFGARVVPEGGNTGLAHGTVYDGPGLAVTLSLGRMNAIRAADRVAMTMEVEAGCILHSAKQRAREIGRQLPISIAAEGSAQIGGLIATNAGGINVLRYGMTRQQVLGLEVVLGDGTVLQGLRSLRKDNAGFDWKQWFIGSEGALGVITAAVLKLAPPTRHKVTALIVVESCEAALELLASLQDQLGDAISAFELVAASSLRLVEQHFGLAPPTTVRTWCVILDAESALPGLREAAEEALAAAFEADVATNGVLAENETQAKAIWSLREHLTEAEHREGASAKHDISVPIAAIPAFLREATEAIVQRWPGLRVNPFGHIGDGNIHFNVLLAEGVQTSDVNEIVHALAIAYGGSVSAEHGIGRYRVEALRAMRAPSELALMQDLKDLLDPHGNLNPGVVLSGRRR